METALLDWATKVSTSDETPASRPLKKPGQIDQKWFKALFGEEKEVDRMKKLLQELDDADDDRRIDIFGDLEYMCELTHNANDLTKIGGLEKAFQYIELDSEEVQVAALNMIGICIPNNPIFCEALMSNDQWFNILYGLYQQSRSQMLQSKAFWAISGLVKALPSAFERFVSDSQYQNSLLAALSNHSNLRVLRRAINLMDFIEVEKPGALGDDLSCSLVDCLKQITDTDCQEQIVLLLRRLHERGQELDNDARQALLQARDTAMANKGDHDPELLLSNIEDLLQAITIKP